MSLKEEISQMLDEMNLSTNFFISLPKNGDKFGFSPLRALIDLKHGIKLFGFYFVKQESIHPPCFSEINLEEHTYVYHPVLVKETFSEYGHYRVAFISADDWQKVDGGINMPPHLLPESKDYFNSRLADVRRDCLNKLLQAMFLHYVENIPLEKITDSFINENQTTLVLLEGDKL